nr:sigma-70 family RNA polymerase sigma factor [Actinomycetota bacterium]
MGGVLQLVARKLEGAPPAPGPREGARARAVRVIERHGAGIMRTARRYSRTPDDAEDAYQRGVEILLTKAPDIPEPELVPWLKTVVKHEAFAIRRQGSRVALGAEDSFEGDTDGDERRLAAVPGPHEQAERLERLRTGAEAMRQLKPQEIRCLTLLAEGYSYSQIQEITGFSYTKVNRCLTEGRQSFRRRLEGIESGAECRRLAPALSALADGEAGADEVLAVRRHLQGCLACRAALRD